jgi:Protein of unknown function (DUF3558)
MRILCTLLIATVVASLSVGCTDSQAGTPRAEPSSQSRVTEQSLARPRSLDLNGADPCKLLTERQLAAFDVDGPTRPGTARGASVLAGSPGCTANSVAEQYGFLIITSTSMGLQEFLSKVQANPSRKNITVDGWPAVEEESLISVPERGSGECYVNVDVAEGQLLQVQFSQIAASPDKRLPIETLCAKAREVAAAALTTLQGG